MTYFLDKTVIAGVEKRQDGSLLVDARVARTGVQLYRGTEVDPKNEHGLRDRAVVRVHRPGSEVFAEDTMKTLAHRPVTNDHPPEMVDSTNWKKYAVGQTADEIKGESIFLRVPLMVSDQTAISDIESGKRELSAGYWSELDFTPGKTESGQSYDAVQKNIRFNHVAIVQRGRAGAKVRIGDEAGVWADDALVEDGDEGEGTMADKPLKTVTVDGLSIETTDQGAQVIEKLQSQVRTLTDAATTTKAAHDAALAAKDKEIATKDAEIEKLKPQILDAAALDKRVTERVELVGRARKVVKDVKVAGLTDADIRKTVVTSKLGEAAVKDKSDAYIEARFDALVDSAGTSAATADSVRSVIADGVEPTNDAEKEVKSAYDKMVEDMTNPKPAAKAA